MYVDFFALCVAADTLVTVIAVTDADPDNVDDVDTQFDDDWCCCFVKYLTNCKFIAAGVLFAHNSSAPLLLILSNDNDLQLLVSDFPIFFELLLLYDAYDDGSFVAYETLLLLLLLFT